MFSNESFHVEAVVRRWWFHLRCRRRLESRHCERSYPSKSLGLRRTVSRRKRTFDGLAAAALRMMLGSSSELQKVEESRTTC